MTELLTVDGERKREREEGGEREGERERERKAIRTRGGWEKGEMADG